jgi:hypothetical protein
VSNSDLVYLCLVIRDLFLFCLFFTLSVFFCGLCVIFPHQLCSAWHKVSCTARLHPAISWLQLSFVCSPSYHCTSPYAETVRERNICIQSYTLHWYNVWIICALSVCLYTNFMLCKPFLPPLLLEKFLLNASVANCFFFFFCLFIIFCSGIEPFFLSVTPPSSNLSLPLYHKSFRCIIQVLHSLSSISKIN